MAPSPRSMDSNPSPVVDGGIRRSELDGARPVRDPGRGGIAGVTVSPVRSSVDRVELLRAGAATDGDPRRGPCPARAAGAAGVAVAGRSRAGRAGRGRRVTGRDADERRAEEDAGDGDGDRAIRPEATHEGARRAWRTGRSATTVRSRAGTSRDAATTVEQPFRTWPAAARPRAFTAVAVASRGGDGRCRRPRTRWTPTVALSNTVSWKWTVPQRLGSRRGLGVSRGTVRGRGIELGSLLAAEIPSTRAYDIKGNPNTDVATRANTRSGPRWPSVTWRESRVSPRGRG